MHTCRSFAAKHYRISAFQYGISNISYFTSVWFNTIYHALHHLCRYYYGLCPVHTFSYQFLLYQRYFLYRQLYTKIALADEVKYDTYMGTGPSPTGREIAGIVKKHLPNAEIAFDENARVPAWNFDNSRAVKEFDWEIQSVEQMVLDEINGTRQAAGLPSVTA